LLATSLWRAPSGPCSGMSKIVPDDFVACFCLAIICLIEFLEVPFNYNSQQGCDIILVTYLSNLEPFFYG